MRPFRWLIAVLALVVVLCAGWYAYLQHRASGLFEESERIARRMVVAELAADQTHPTLAVPVEDFDARTIYDEVLARVGSLDEEEKELLSLHGWFSEQPPPLDQEAGIDAALAKTRPMVERLRAVLRAGRLSLPPNLGAWDDSLGKSIAPLQVLSHVLAGHARRHLVRAEADRALDLYVLRWLCGRDVAWGGVLISYLVGHSLASESATGIRRVLAESDVSVARLERLASELEVLRGAMPTEESAWRREEISLRRLFQREARKASGALWIDDDMLDLSNLYSDRFLIANALRDLSGTRNAYIDTVAGKPGLAAVSAAEVYAKEVEARGNPLVSMIFVLGPIVTVRAPELAMRADLLRVTVALARHRERHGTLPVTLDELVPTFLPAIPTCAYTGTALRYDGERVWSIGGNVKDDGGVPLPFDEPGVEDDEGDVVYTLHRRELQTFPWPEDVDSATRARVEEAIEGLYLGGRAGREGRAALVELERDICGRLIGEFKAIADGLGFESREGRMRAGVLDQTLRAIDGVMECRWDQRGRIRVTSDSGFVHTIALRWANWWYRGAWHTDSLAPWDPDDD